MLVENRVGVARSRSLGGASTKGIIFIRFATLFVSFEQYKWLAVCKNKGRPDSLLLHLRLLWYMQKVVT